MQWTIEEMRKDGIWVPCKEAPIWQTNQFAHAQRNDLAAKHPDKIYAVTPAGPLEF